MKRIAVIGATGTIGGAVADALDHRGDEVHRLSRRSSPALDIEQPGSVRQAFEALGPLDGIVCTAGRASFGALRDLSDEDIALGLQSKLRGQVDLVRIAPETLVPGGVVVLTSGMLAHTPTPRTSGVALVNGALESFVRAAALDLTRHRVHIVSPPLIKETAVAMGRPDAPAPTAAQVAQHFLAALDDETTGRVHFVTGHEPSWRNA